MNDRTIMDAAARELSAVIAALLETTGQAEPAAVPPSDPLRLVRVGYDGPATGTLVVGLGLGAARLLAGLVMPEEASSDAAADNTLQEVCGQMFGALATHGELAGLRLSNVRMEATVPSGTPSPYRIVAGDRFDATVALWAWTAAATVAQAPPSPPATVPANLDVILDIDLPLSVRFGETDMTLLSLTRLAPGSLIDLGRSPEDPVDVLVNGRLVARGEVVAVGGNYGVRITEIVNAADRLRSMGV